MRVVLTTSKGDITFQLNETDAPLACANFVKLVNDGFYAGKSFHRVIENFVAQAGCSKGDGTGGPGWDIEYEKNKRRHVKGSVAMARLPGDRNHGSQFYIARTTLPHLDQDYTIFGAVTAGLPVLDKLTQGDTITAAKVV